MEASIDVVKILGYGLSGFAFLLVFLAFMLLRKEQDRDNPRKIIMQTIWMFMGLCLVMTVVVGLLSIPISRNNDKIAHHNEMLAGKNDSLGTQLYVYRKIDSAAQSVGELAMAVSSDMTLDPQRISKAEEMVMDNLDDVSKHLISEPGKVTAGDTVITSVSPVRADIARDFKILRSNPPKDSVQLILQRIQSNTRKIKAQATFKTLAP